MRHDCYTRSKGASGGVCVFFFFCQAEDGIRGLVRSRGLGDVYKRQVWDEYCRREGVPTDGGLWAPIKAYEDEVLSGRA